MSAVILRYHPDLNLLRGCALFPIHLMKVYAPEAPSTPIMAIPTPNSLRDAVPSAPGGLDPAVEPPELSGGGVCPLSDPPKRDVGLAISTTPASARKLAICSFLVYGSFKILWQIYPVNAGARNVITVASARGKYIMDHHIP
jgi:hypothetical protein